MSVVGNIDRKRKTTPTTVYVMFSMDKNLIVEMEDLYHLILSTLCLNVETAPRTSQADIGVCRLVEDMFSFDEAAATAAGAGVED